MALQRDIVDLAKKYLKNVTGTGHQPKGDRYSVRIRGNIADDRMVYVQETSVGIYETRVRSAM